MDFSEAGSMFERFQVRLSADFSAGFDPVFDADFSAGFDPVFDLRI
jgi:hypothetical protein